MSWERKSLGSFVEAGAAEIQTGPFGTQLRASDYVPEGVPVINVRNIGYGDLRSEKLEYVPEELADRMAAHVLESGDIVFGRKGAVDRHLLVTPECAQWMQGSDCIRLRLSGDVLIPRYVSYAMLEEPHKKWMLAQCGNKATMASLNHDVIKRIEIFVPPVPVQREIVGVLTAYDDLIENNRRRIKLLEDSARLLYREWFVHLRFPGHEHVKVVDGVPEGWGKRPMSAVCVMGDGIQTGPFGSQLHQYEYADIGIPVVMPKDLIDFRIDTSTIARVPIEVANRLARHRMEEGDVVYGRRGDIGRRAFISKEQVGFVCGTGCLRLRANPEVIAPQFFFDSLGSPETLGLIVGRAKGSTMPNLNAGILADIPILVPTASLQNEYVEFIQVTSAQIATLSQQNETLRQARDLLLPRLMRGDLAV